MKSDVCLLLEGSFPYTSGGVAAWVNNLIRHMPDTSFSAVYIGPYSYMNKRMHYEIPHNVVDFREYYLFDFSFKKQRKGTLGKEVFERIEKLVMSIRAGDPSQFNKLINFFGDDVERIPDMHDMIFSYDMWKVLLDVYGTEMSEQSFIDYFWTWRSIYMPFFNLLRWTLPPAKMYHSISTGYAGVIGSIAKLRTKKPFILTEHGIYSRERKIEIMHNELIYSDSAGEAKVTEEQEFFKDWWIKVFSFLCKVAYNNADSVVTLFEKNRLLQVEEGAEASKTMIISNGIEVEKFRQIVRTPHEGVHKIGFVGRVVPIKDVKTYIKACKGITHDLSNCEFYIIGPTDEDEDYYQECISLVDNEGMQDSIRFTGKVDVREYYKDLDIIVLTSISEAQPLVILEAGACGIPVVSTDVGSCRELLYGGTPDDKLLGKSGLVTPVCSSESTARAVVAILKDKGMWNLMAENGKRRVDKYYQIYTEVASYEHLYSRYKEVVEWLE
ncbi:GT4 family glycosyltransferase PelF [Candidatus Auribacterota bacterium]